MKESCDPALAASRRRVLRTCAHQIAQPDEKAIAAAGSTRSETFNAALHEEKNKRAGNDAEAEKPFGEYVRQVFQRVAHRVPLVRRCFHQVRNERVREALERKDAKMKSADRQGTEDEKKITYRHTIRSPTVEHVPTEEFSKRTLHRTTTGTNETTTNQAGRNRCV